MTATTPPKCNWSEVDPALGRTWAQQYIDRATEAGPTPMFGTPEWAQLDNTDPRKVAACVTAALWFADQHTPEAIEQRADRDDLLDRLDEKRFAMAFSASRESWGTCRSWQELRQLRTTYTDRPPLDPDALARWVRTGSSELQEVAA